MNISALLTSAGINIGLCVVLLLLYSLLRKQPSNLTVYFGRRLAQARPKRFDSLCFDRFVPSPSWIVKAWETSEEELLSLGGLDAVVFIRTLVFSLRVFSIAAFFCMFLVLPVNYYGQEMHHKEIPYESLEVFTIGNVKEGSKWLWAHCLALYIISCSAWLLLYFEYKSIANMRLAHIKASATNPSHFTMLVRAIPWSPEESYSDSVDKFFSNYYLLTYMGHQMVYRSGTVQKLMSDAEMMCRMMRSENLAVKCKQNLFNCGLCGGPSKAFRMLSKRPESVKGKSVYGDLDTSTREEVAAAFVFFKTRYAALVASQVLQSLNPMLWVTDLAPEPHDVYWSNLCIPFRQLWIRKIATLLAAIVFMFLFLIPVTFVQGLTQLDQLHHSFPFLRGLLKKKFMNQLVTGYLPSVVLMLFLYIVPPTMMLFSAVEGSFSRSGRKKSACRKVLYFMIWNVFFVNVLSGSVISQLNVISSPKGIPAQLARAVPTQASFFMTYILTSGWASLASEVMQPFALLWNLIRRFILRKKDDLSDKPLSFPYHIEVPRVLLFGLLGFTFSILAPLMLPFLLAYFLLAFLVYRNQILNVYTWKYETGGQLWPTIHNTTIFSLVLMQIIALGVFGLKRSPVASGFTIPLIICTLLFNEYCRQRFHPIFKNNAAQMLIDMDRQDEQSGRMEDIHRQLPSAYCQFSSSFHDLYKSGHHDQSDNGENIRDSEDEKPGEDSKKVNEPLALHRHMESKEPNGK
ncbi:CSC1-like protein RXW8 isoform X2 [Syzygium oleosum]|uniref:CSC1-like protein RXW8 isoform X2 n=1 Tax=Syzygium oleosum TaxID=219896 RepID=UPI0011D1D368|nr:CSC1-like protein RXW8 isoform X2 [Syzygium oleosum]